MADFLNNQDHDREWENCPECEQRVNPYHHGYCSSVNQHRIDSAHTAKTGQHPNVCQVIGKAGYYITAAAVGKVAEIKSGQLPEEVVTDAEFNNSGRIHDECTRENTGDAVKDRKKRNNQGACRWRIAGSLRMLQRLYRQFHKPGNQKRKSVG